MIAVVATTSCRAKGPASKRPFSDGYCRGPNISHRDRYRFYRQGWCTDQMDANRRVIIPGVGDIFASHGLIHQLMAVGRAVIDTGLHYNGIVAPLIVGF